MNGLAAIVYTSAASLLLWPICRHYYAALGEAEVHSLYRLLWLAAICPTVVLAAVCVLHLCTLKHGNERIVVTPEGFEHRGKDGQTIAGTWESVLDYYVAPTGHFCGTHSVVALRGSDEKSWSFTPLIRASYDLHYIINRYAPAPQTKPYAGALWPLKTDERAISSPSGRIYSYRNRGMRALLVVGSLFLAMMPASMLMDVWLKIRPHRNDDPVFVVCLLLVLTAGMAYGWWRYRQAKIETDDFWITQKTLFGRRRILWLAVSDYKEKDGTYFVYGRDKKPVVFWSALSQVEELKAEIERRAPSPKTGWAVLADEQRTYADQSGGDSAGRAKR